MLYHCLLVGLQDLSLDTKQRLTPEQLETEIRENLSKADLQAFDMLCMKPSDERITELLEAAEDLRADSPLREEDLRAQLLLSGRNALAQCVRA